ncbi:L-histidine N(alpha)-methyltransferase [Kineosporia mesophila]|nr:L-histidine N(alpha)-methyltransferase [Kineosporia mesophila]MCD5351348.1 L-histidine N(alpha)-methyltransferase [Kineosporia mesophila]
MDSSKRDGSRPRRLAPDANFYELYDESEVLDIASSLDLYRTIPLQYGYFGGGAQHWSDYVQRMADQDLPNTLVRTQQLLDINFAFLQELIAPHGRINIVDIGPGDCSPVKGLLARLQEEELLGRYIALDTSRAMREIAAKNIHTWFGGAIGFEGHRIDMTRESFRHVIRSQAVVGEQHRINVALLLGGTLYNFREPEAVLTKIRQSLSPGDLLVHVVKIDSPRTRQFFDFNTVAEMNAPLSRDHRLVLESLGISPDLYDLENGYDPADRRRYIRVRLRESVELFFTTGVGDRVVSLAVGEPIHLWHYWHHDQLQVREQLVRGGFYPLLLCEYPDHDYLLCICRVEAGREASSQSIGPAFT